jgi:hypothetical protein
MALGYQQIPGTERQRSSVPRHRLIQAQTQKFVNLAPRWDSALTAGLSCLQRRCCRSQTNAFAERCALTRAAA